MTPSLDIVLLISRWLHISAAIVAVGGVFFTRLVLSRAAEHALPDEMHAQLREAVRVRWAPVVHACIAVLFVTGAYNFVVMALPPKINPIPYHPIFGVKFLAALGVFFIAEALAGRGAAFQGMRSRRPFWLVVLLALGGLIVLVSGVLNQVRVGQLAAGPNAMQTSPASSSRPSTAGS
jgi:hypothetical protein